MQTSYVSLSSRTLIWSQPSLRPPTLYCQVVKMGSLTEQQSTGHCWLCGKCWGEQNSCRPDLDLSKLLKGCIPPYLFCEKPGKNLSITTPEDNKDAVCWMESEYMKLCDLKAEDIYLLWYMDSFPFDLSSLVWWQTWSAAGMRKLSWNWLLPQKSLPFVLD